MSLAKTGIAVSLLFFIVFPSIPNVFASSDSPDVSGVSGAYGTVVDSVTVTGNKRTKTFVILREMQTQPGDVLDAKAIRRDLHYLSDLSPFAEVDFKADSIGPGRTALRIHVIERSGLFLKSILPFVKYNFESGLEYGVRWRDKNFRGRLQQVSLSYTRNEQQDESISLGWSSPWVGWRHIGVGGRVRYFNRGDSPRTISVLENLGLSGFVALPLTKSRIRFSQLQGSLSFDKTRNGAIDLATTKELTISPQIGYRFDSRDSRIKPETGQTFFAGIGQSIPIDDGRGPYYRFQNRVRLFFGVSRKSVIAMQSNFFYQFGDFPEYSTVGMGGARTLRGYPDDRFTGFHRWFGALEWRYMYLPRKVFAFPVVKQVDVGLAFVAFIDGGIVWRDSSEFELDRLHGTSGCGIRLYSPLRDVLRLDFGFSANGDARFHAGTGIRF